MLETSAPWTITGPDGTTVQFNSGGSLILQDVTGFDSPNVRQNVEDLPETDGAIAGDFFLGSRPVTLSGLINGSTAAQRNTDQVNGARAFRALRGDLTIQSQPQGLPAMQTTARLVNFRVTGGFVKQFQLSLVCADPFLYSVLLHSLVSSGAGAPAGAAFPWSFDVYFGGGTGGIANLTVSNSGNIGSYPVVTVNGPITNPYIENTTTGAFLYLDGLILAGGESVTVDMKQRTAVRNSGANVYQAVRFPDSTWWTLQPGGNLVQLWASSYSAGAGLQVVWRDAWV